MQNTTRHIATRAIDHEVDRSTNEHPAPLLSQALDSHGGLERWRQFAGVASTIVVGGALWRIKGLDLDRTPHRTTSEFHRQWTRQTAFGNPDWTMTWTPRHAEIVDRDGQGDCIAAATGAMRSTVASRGAGIR